MGARIIPELARKDRKTTQYQWRKDAQGKRKDKRKAPRKDAGRCL
jgi:hypothetical protein